MPPYCSNCERHGHSPNSCNAEFCSGCGKVIQSVHNSARGNYNNLETHMQYCSEYQNMESECQTCGYSDHYTWHCNAIICDFPGCNRVIQSKQNNQSANQNNLEQHKKTHAPRNARCPACGEQRFRNATGVALHFEGGHCSACRGSSNAEAAVFQFVRKKMPNYINRQAICDSRGADLTWMVDKNHVPEQAYQCRYCERTFSKFASLTQHIEDKHGRNAPNLPALLY